MMKSKVKLTGLLIGSLLLLVTVFLSVDPEGRPLIFVFVPVLLIWVALYSGAKLSIEVFFKNPSKMHSVIAFVASSFLVLLFLLSGIGQLTLRDVILVLSLGVVSGFYFYRTWF